MWLKSKCPRTAKWWTCDWSHALRSAGAFVYGEDAPAVGIMNFAHFRFDPDKDTDSDTDIFNLPFYDNFAPIRRRSAQPTMRATSTRWHRARHLHVPAIELQICRWQELQGDGHTRPW